MSVGAMALSAVVAGTLGLGSGFAVCASRGRRSDEGGGGRSAAEAGMTVSEVLQRVVASAPVGVVVVDRLRDVVVSNERATELGLVREGLLDERVWAAAQRTLTHGEDVDVDLAAPVGVAGRRFGLSVRGSVRLLSPENPRLAVIYLDDQSEQARMEASRRDFVANVSHELKTPVAAMGVLAEALLESTDDPETAQRFGQKLLTESQRLANMVGELIELSRLQGAERLPDLVSVDVDSVVQEAISRHKVAADSADITISTDAPSGLHVLGDQGLLVTAMANLISNAIAYSPDSSTVSISRRRGGDEVEVSVTDRGIGIALADQERVFERFFRVDKARSRATGGTGLG
ncbi:MAG: ATP-binding protein, partial [Mycobacteriaceae bacterium]